MRPNRGIVALLVFAALGALAAAARADDITLKSGRTLSGKIVSESDAEVVFEYRGGRLTMAKSLVESIKRSPAPTTPPATSPAPAPEAPPPAKPDAPPETKRTGAGAQDRAPAATKPAAEKAKRPTIFDRLQELESLRLAPWIQEDSTLVTEPGAKGYKSVRADGRVSMLEERPATGDGIDALYVMKDADCGAMIAFRNGVRQFYWYRLYWHAERREWNFVHPDLEIFDRDSALAGLIADETCKDETGRIRGWVEQKGLEYEWERAGRDAPAVKQRKELREACALATGSDGAGELLARFHELNLEIGFSRTPAEKIRFAMERRGVVRELVAASGK